MGDEYTFGERLRHFRKSRALTQREVAKKLGCHVNTIGNWERGETGVPSRDEVLQLARHLGLNGLEKNQLLTAAGYAPVVLADEKQSTRSPVPLQWLPPVDYFTGREGVVETVLEHLQSGNPVTLWGASGMGKSAIAAEVLRRLSPARGVPVRFPDGVVVHEFYLSPTAEAALQHIAESFGEEPTRDPVAAVRRILTGRQALIVLDGAEAADDLRRVLHACSGAALMVTTTRRPDHLRGELVTVGPLSDEQGRLLLHRWIGAEPDDVDVARIVEFVDGLPFALHLAGAYIQQEGDPSDYLAWLEKAPFTALRKSEAQRRHESVAALLEQSIARLQPDTKMVLALVGRLALAPFSREELAVALGYAESDDVRPALREMLGYGLVTAAEGAFRVNHRLIHEYAGRKMSLPREGVTALAVHYGARINTLWQQEPRPLASLRALRPHVLAILDHLEKVEAWEEILYLAQSADPFWEAQGPLGERLMVCQRAVRAADGAEREREKITWLQKCGNVHHLTGAAREAENFYRQALRLSRATGERRREGQVLSNLGSMYGFLHRWEEALSHFQQALAVTQELQNRQEEGAILGNIGSICWAQQEFDRARTYFQQALAISREVGSRKDEGRWLSNLASVALALQKYDEAIALNRQALTISRDLGERRNEGVRAGNLGNIYRETGNFVEASRLIQHALDISREIGDRLMEGFQHEGLGELFRDRGDAERAVGHWRQAVAIFQAIESPRVAHVEKLLEEMGGPGEPVDSL